MKYPEIYTTNGKKYKLIKVHKHYGLYEDENGFKTCFKPYDLDLVPVYKTKKDWWNVMPVIF